MKKVKVMVVDDSAFMRKMISDMIKADDELEVVASARNGEELIKKLSTYDPDVITLDVEMPIMDGLSTLREMKRLGINKKIIMVSAVTVNNSKLTLECLQEGAVDFILKPSGSISLDIDKIKLDLINKIRTISLSGSKTFEKSVGTTRDRNILKRDENRSNIRGNDIYKAIVIAASTGGPKAVHTVIESLPSNMDVPIFIVQHMPQGFTKAFADRLNRTCKLKVTEAIHEDIIEKNHVYIAPGGYHMEIGSKDRIILTKEPTLWGVRPAADKLFKSAARIYGDKLISVVLTGMGRDGASGTVEVKNFNGYTISQDEDTCVIYGMPKTTFETGAVDEVLPLNEIGKRLAQLVRRG